MTACGLTGRITRRVMLFMFLMSLMWCPCGLFLTSSKKGTPTSRISTSQQLTISSGRWLKSEVMKKPYSRALSLHLLVCKCYSITTSHTVTSGWFTFWRNSTRHSTLATCTPRSVPTSCRALCRTHTRRHKGWRLIY